jgi:hypothetical protein
MQRSPEQKVADEALRAAIETLARMDSEGENDGVLVDFMVVAQYASFDDEGHEVSAYFLQFPNGALATHRAVGLADYAKALLLRNAREVD